MGKSSTFTETTATHNCVEKKKRRRLHPVRRIARLLLGGSKSKREGRDTTSADGDNHETEGKTCYGASRWQNVLPFLEPLIALDPKLSFIEDRILKRPTPTTSEKVRQQQHKPEPPRTLRHLQQRVQDEDVFCNCDECAPKYYKISTTASHGTIRDLPPQDSQSTTSTKKTRSFQTPLQLKTPTPILPTLTLRFHGGTYEAMTLVRHHIAWLDATYLHPSASPTVAVKKLRTLLTAWHPHLSSANLRHTLSTHQLATLFSHLNAVFFAGCVPPHNKTLSAGFSYLSFAASVFMAGTTFAHAWTPYIHFYNNNSGGGGIVTPLNPSPRNVPRLPPSLHLRRLSHTRLLHRAPRPRPRVAAASRENRTRGFCSPGYGHGSRALAGVVARCGCWRGVAELA
ncbi:hypothetical protein A1F94_006769 [Pyrenophora tritici-repentis]|nr:hypothetical protein PtrV1_12956 [Pyrenophora tritici-repentis]KAG9382848.1 hypothetical protein A1F94_006769 [Pyrenophora tritici-repentis]KAI0580810.1 hypothetical protein Alg215_04999 [Pyrenophora tritici-repentis]KAI1543134.1 hypothetical protein PtrSN001A_003183 [Pyrenophora tritici-repentis]KAI1544975.1 hypothetical protein PtrSN001C_003322 [Pyrenophora tritici-repentis]